MPELPDVETFRRHLPREGLHRRIERVDPLDETACQDTTPRALSEALRWQELATTSRRGKRLFAATTGRSTLVLHFGMTGYLVIDGAAETVDPHERSLKSTLLTAADRDADRDADPQRFPRGWLVRHRHEGAPCPRCGTPFQKARLAGRSAYFCPGCQH